jgi:hypothetical protein
VDTTYFFARSMVTGTASAVHPSSQATCLWPASATLTPSSVALGAANRGAVLVRHCGSTFAKCAACHEIEFRIDRQSVGVEWHEDRDPQLKRETIFDAAAGPRTIPAVLERLGLTEPTPVIVIIGGADRMSSDISEDVRALFERSLAPVLESSGAVVLTGGTDSGVMAIAGQTLYSAATLVGVSPGGALADNPSVPIEPNHHLSVLTAGKTWGSETDYMVRLATAITHGARCGVVILVNGGPIAYEEIKYFVDAGWPILSVAGSGGAADDLVASTEKRGAREYDWSSLRHADLAQLDIHGSPYEVRKRFHWYVSQDELLKAAWTYYLAFDRNASRQQRINKWIRLGLQLGSLAIVSIVLIQVQANLPTTGNPSYLSWIGEPAVLQAIKDLTGPIAVALPIALATASAFSQSVAADRAWRVMRGAAESLRREIYRYRAWLVCNPDNASSSGAGRQDLQKTIASALRRSAGPGFLLSVDLTSRRRRPEALNEGDDELAPLSVASYTSHRIDGQITYFRNKGRALRTKALVVVLSAVLLAAFSGTVATSYYAPWAAMAVLIVTTLNAYLERSRLTDRANRFATASADLAEIKTGVNVGTENLGQPEALLSVVNRTEAALEREGGAWEQLVWRDVRESQ